MAAAFVEELEAMRVRVVAIKSDQGDSTSS
jgi:hypothetical protein